MAKRHSIGTYTEPGPWLLERAELARIDKAILERGEELFRNWDQAGSTNTFDRPQTKLVVEFSNDVEIEVDGLSHLLIDISVAEHDRVKKIAYTIGSDFKYVKIEIGNNELYGDLHITVFPADEAGLVSAAKRIREDMLDFEMGWHIRAWRKWRVGLMICCAMFFVVSLQSIWVSPTYSKLPDAESRVSKLLDAGISQSEIPEALDVLLRLQAGPNILIKEGYWSKPWLIILSMVVVNAIISAIIVKTDISLLKRSNRVRFRRRIIQVLLAAFPVLVVSVLCKDAITYLLRSIFV